MNYRRRIKKELVLMQLRATGRNITVACKRANVGRTQFYEWMKIDPQFRKEVEKLIYKVNQYSKCLLYSKAIKGDTRAIVRLNLKSIRNINNLTNKTKNNEKENKKEVSE